MLIIHSLFTSPQSQSHSLCLDWIRYHILTLWYQNLQILIIGSKVIFYFSRPVHDSVKCSAISCGSCIFHPFSLHFSECVEILRPHL